MADAASAIVAVVMGDVAVAVESSRDEDNGDLTAATTSQAIPAQSDTDSGSQEMVEAFGHLAISKGTGPLPEPDGAMRNELTESDSAGAGTDFKACMAGLEMTTIFTTSLWDVRPSEESQSSRIDTSEDARPTQQDARSAAISPPASSDPAIQSASPPPVAAQAPVVTAVSSASTDSSYAVLVSASAAVSAPLPRLCPCAGFLQKQGGQ